MKWQIQQQLDSDTDVETIIDTLLKNRGLISEAEKQVFFHPQSPLALQAEQVGLNQTQLTKAIERIFSAIKNNHSIVIYGDYDADGICATALLWQTLHLMKANVMPFIPDREKHGYGISLDGINQILDQYRPDLVITVDNGIVAHQPAKYLKKQKVDLIITDHHQQDNHWPVAEALVHSTQICGSGVSWFVARELLREFDSKTVEPRAQALLDLVAIGTIADLMPMMGVNRSLARFGLEQLTHTKRPGLVAIKTEAGIEPGTQMNSYHVGYVIGPRINAMGRIDHGLSALRLLCTRNHTQAQKLSLELSKVNRQRQDMTAEAIGIAQEIYQADSDLQGESIIVISHPDFHEGIIGLVAGKLTEKYHKPSIVIAENKSISKGSARSVSGVNIIELIRHVDSYLLGAGGHPGAAGLSLETTRISKFKQAIESVAAESIPSELLEKTLRVDAQIPLELATFELYKRIAEFAPFGMNNPRPVLASEVEIIDYRIIGRQKDHIKIIVGLSSESEVQIESIGFGMAETVALIEQKLERNIAYTLDKNEWNGRTSLQLVLKDVQ